MKKRSIMQKLTHFLNGNGFYIALACCVAVIGVSGWFLWQDISTASRLAAETGRSQTVVVEPSPAAEDPEPAPVTAPADESEDTDEPEDEAEGEAEQSEAADTPTAESAPAEPVMEEHPATETMEQVSVEETQDIEPVHGWLWPLEGAVVETFSSDTLTYNKALGDWRTHSGIDLAAELGQSVTAVCAGTVISIREDALLGQTVVMDCGNDITVSYSNLSPDVVVTAGERLSAGDLIGTVGETAVGESSESPWLHFSICRKGEPVDPAGFLQ